MVIKFVVNEKIWWRYRFAIDDAFNNVLIIINDLIKFFAGLIWFYWISLGLPKNVFYVGPDFLRIKHSEAAPAIAIIQWLMLILIYIGVSDSAGFGDIFCVEILCWMFFRCFLVHLLPLRSFFASNLLVIILLGWLIGGGATFMISGAAITGSMGSRRTIVTILTVPCANNQALMLYVYWKSFEPSISIISFSGRIISMTLGSACEPSRSSLKGSLPIVLWQLSKFSLILAFLSLQSVSAKYHLSIAFQMIKFLLNLG